MASSTEDPSGKIVKIGLNVYMGGIGFQELFVLIFTVMVITFHRRMRGLQSISDDCKPGWKKMTFVLYAVITLITVRFNVGKFFQSQIDFFLYRSESSIVWLNSAKGSIQI